MGHVSLPHSFLEQEYDQVVRHVSADDLRVIESDLPLPDHLAQSVKMRHARELYLRIKKEKERK